MRLYFIALILVIIGLGGLLDLFVWEGRNSISAANNDTGACSNLSKDQFSICLIKNFQGKSVSLLDTYLTEEGFIRAEQNPDETFFYYQRSANDLSGYRVAVIAWIDDEMKVSTIELR